MPSAPSGLSWAAPSQWSRLSFRHVTAPSTDAYMFCEIILPRSLAMSPCRPAKSPPSLAPRPMCTRTSSPTVCSLCMDILSLCHADCSAPPVSHSWHHGAVPWRWCSVCECMHLLPWRLIDHFVGLCKMLLSKLPASTWPRFVSLSHCAPIILLYLI